MAKKIVESTKSTKSTTAKSSAKAPIKGKVVAKEASAKISAGFSKEQLAMAKAAYSDDIGYDVYAKVYALDGALFEILENKKTGEGIVFRLPFSTSAAEKGKNPYTEIIPWALAPSAFAALYKLNGIMKEENASAWRLQRKAQEEMKKVAKEMRIEEKEAARKEAREKVRAEKAKKAPQEETPSKGKATAQPAKGNDAKKAPQSAKNGKEDAKKEDAKKDAKKPQRVKV